MMNKKESLQQAEVVTDDYSLTHMSGIYNKLPPMVVSLLWIPRQLVMQLILQEPEKGHVWWTNL